DHMTLLANQIGEKTLFGRVGGAPTLAVGMANIFSKVCNDKGLGLWYHFAIMFEALFILTTLDAGTRVGRYLLQDFLGHVWKPLGDTKKFGANFFASILMVGAWGYFLIQGVRDPLGGINSLWPLFGIANQLLAAIALCLAVTIILKMQLKPAENSWDSRLPSARTPPGENLQGQAASILSDAGTTSPSPIGWERAGVRASAHGEVAPSAQGVNSKPGKPAFALVALLPLFWLLAVTMTAGIQKVWSANPKIGFLAQVSVLKSKIPNLESAFANAKTLGDPKAIEAAEKALQTNRILIFNNRLDAVVAGTFLFLVGAIFLISVREWLLLLAR